MTSRTICAAVFASLGLVAVCSAETLDEVKSKIADQVSKYKSMQFKQKSTTDYKSSQGQIKSEVDMVAKYERRPDKKFVSRVEANSVTLAKNDNEEKRIKADMLTVVDGKNVYILSKSEGNTTAMKQKLDPAMAGNPFQVADVFKMMEKDFNFKLLPDEKLEGKDCWVIEAAPTDPEKFADTMARMVTHYDKKTALSVKAVAYNKEGKATTTTVTSDLKLDEDIPDDQFEFKAPAGVQVIDMTQMGQQDTASSQPAQGEPSEKPAAKSDKPEEAKPADKPAENKPAEKPAEKKNDAGKAVKGLLKGLGR